MSDNNALNDKASRYDLFKIGSAGYSRETGTWWVNVHAWPNLETNMVDQHYGEGVTLEAAVLQAIQKEENQREVSDQ